MRTYQVANRILYGDTQQWCELEPRPPRLDILVLTWNDPDYRPQQIPTFQRDVLHVVSRTVCWDRESRQGKIALRSEKNSAKTILGCTVLTSLEELEVRMVSNRELDGRPLRCGCSTYPKLMSTRRMNFTTPIRTPPSIVAPGLACVAAKGW